MSRSGMILALLLGVGVAVAAADDLDSTYQSLQEATAKKDPELVKKLAAQCVALARKEESTPVPTDKDEQEVWKSHIAYVKEVEGYAEYALYATAVGVEPAVTVDLISTLEAQNPKSKYLDQGYGTYFVALAKTGAEAKVPQVAEKALANFPDNPDLLLVMINTALSHKQTDRALTYANRMVGAMGKRSKPEGVAAADWERQKSAFLGRGYFVAGVINAEKSRFVDADRNLRAALPFIKGDQAMTGEAFFHLGVANYQLGKMTNSKAKVLEGAKFSDDASKITGPYAHQAYLNSMAMKSDAEKMR